MLSLIYQLRMQAATGGAIALRCCWRWTSSMRAPRSQRQSN
jgi:hypothetical protein